MLERLRAIYRNRFVRFAFVTLLYLFVVIWTGHYLWLIGLLVVFDHYITRKVHWFFWRKKGVKKQKAWVEWVDAILDGKDSSGGRLHFCEQSQLRA